MTKRVGILHAAGYVGLSVYRCLLRHPHVEIVAISSRSLSGKSVRHAAPELAGVASHCFVKDFDPQELELDCVFVCSEHGASATCIAAWLDSGYQGQIIDMSADFRLADADQYPQYYQWQHPRPELSGRFSYGLAEITKPDSAVKLIANPGCFATGIALACFPVAGLFPGISLKVTALTGASGSGFRPKTTTHYPNRDNNVSAYKVLKHQHLGEVLQVMPSQPRISFVPASGPWTRGIWGTVQFDLPSAAAAEALVQAYVDHYETCPLVRLRGEELPVLAHTVNTPFCDLGWTFQADQAVVGFALDNLMKGAASQAVQNFNRINGWKETIGLLPGVS